ncbi:unnamed protein product [Auanema sp. JU1783]|nr:unnamed protein product [Auanema sp. JU1783]
MGHARFSYELLIFSLLDSPESDDAQTNEEKELQQAIMLSLGGEPSSKDPKVSDAQDARSKRDLSRFM